MIVNDHRSVSIALAGALTFALCLAIPQPARADAAASAGAPVAAPAAPDAAPDAPAGSGFNVTLVADGQPRTVITQAGTVAELLAEHRIRVAKGDFVSAPLDAGLGEGVSITYRRALLVDIFVGKHKRTVRSSAGTIGELLAEQRIGIGPHDRVTPPLGVPPIPNDVVRVTRIDSWTARERQTLPPTVRERDDASLAMGKTVTIDVGRPGIRESIVRFVSRDGARPIRTVLASHVIRAPRPRIVARGIAEYSSLARVAEQGFNSAMHIAGTALQMIATAYTAGCYGCSGITATGSHAGFGIIAVDPNVIPLGTKLYIPGYGRAIAGDTGGAIVGRRVDLGMNTLADALRFGRRAVTVYVLR